MHSASRQVLAVANQLARLRLGTEAESWRRSPVYFGLRFRGDIDGEKMSVALTVVLRRHSGLRYFFPNPHSTESARCAESASVSFPLDVVDLSTQVPTCADEQEQQALDKLRQPFEFHAPPLARALLIRRHDHRVLGLAIDHIVFDAASVGILIADLEYVWNELGSGADPSLLEVEMSDFAKFAHEERQWLAGHRGAAALDFWRPRWQGMGPFPEVPLPPAADGAPNPSGRWERILPAEELALRCREVNGGVVTPFMLIATALFAALRESTSCVDLGLLFPISRRTNAAARKGIGYYNNQLLLRVNLAGAASFEQSLVIVREETLAALRHGTMPYHHLKSLFPKEGQPGAPYLYLNMLPTPTKVTFSGMDPEFTWFEQETALTKLPKLNVICQARPDGSLLIKSAHDGSYFSWPDVQVVLDRMFDLMVG